MAEVTRIYPRGGDREREHDRDRDPDRERQPLPEPLWREVLGSRLRALRAARGETLAATAERAGISPQYLSEVERGRKEPSSEMIAALAGALDTTLADLTIAVTRDLRRTATMTDLRRATPVPAGVRRRPESRGTRTSSTPDIRAFAA